MDIGNAATNNHKGTFKESHPIKKGQKQQIMLDMF